MRNQKKFRLTVTKEFQVILYSLNINLIHQIAKGFNIDSYKSKENNLLPFFSIHLREDDSWKEIIQLDLSTKTAYITLCKKKSEILYNIWLVKSAIAKIGLLFDTLFFHASSTYYKNNGLVFTGPPNVGKSTLVSLLKTPVISDDITLVYKKKDGFYLLSNLFEKKEIYNTRITKKIKLDKIFILYQAKKNKLKTLSIIEVIKLLTSQLISRSIQTMDNNVEKFLLEKEYRLLLKLIKTTSIKALYFNKDINYLIKIL